MYFGVRRASAQVSTQTDNSAVLHDDAAYDRIDAGLAGWPLSQLQGEPHIIFIIYEQCIASSNTNESRGVGPANGKKPSPISHEGAGNLFAASMFKQSVPYGSNLNKMLPAGRSHPLYRPPICRLDETDKANNTSIACDKMSETAGKVLVKKSTYIR
jgi:hypothetical protein